MILIATFVMHHIKYTTPSSGEGWLDRVSSTVFIALGLGGLSVSFGDRNASLGEFRISRDALMIENCSVILESGVVFEGPTVVYEHVCQLVLND